MLPACREASITDFRFHDLRHTFGTRLAEAGVDVVKIKELMGHASIVTTMRYIQVASSSQTKSGRALSLPQVVDIVGAPSRARTCDLLIRSQTLYPTELRVHATDGATKRNKSKTSPIRS